MSRTFIVHLIVAARPNFMKVAPLYHELTKTDWCRPVLVHTGQHYDPAMSSSFLQDLGMPSPDVDLAVGPGSHAEQTAGVMVAYERTCVAAPRSWVVLPGDVNSTLACALAAKKLNLPVAHLEAGLRSHDRTTPEEINRVVVDSISDLLWTPSADADENLQREGVLRDRIDRIGNIMMDAYEMMRPRIAAAKTAERVGADAGGFGLVTLHRPENVDHETSLRSIVDVLGTVASRLPLVFPVHPRTRKQLDRFGLWARLTSLPRLITMEPLGYVDFMSLAGDSRLVITDSGGVQEETTYLGIPCLTLRKSTERPITVAQGTNRLVDPGTLLAQVDRILAGDRPRGSRPDLWDGRSATRATSSLHRRLIAETAPSLPT